MSLAALGTMATKENHVKSISLQGNNNTNFLKLSHGDGGAAYHLQLPTNGPGDTRKALYVSGIDDGGSPVLIDWTNTEFEGAGIQTALINSSIPFLVTRYATPQAADLNGGNIFTTAGNNAHAWTAASLFLGMAKRNSAGTTPAASDTVATVAQVLAVHTTPALVNGDSWELTIIKDTADVNMNWDSGNGWETIGTANTNLQAGTTTTFKFIVSNIDVAAKILVLPVARVV